MKNEYNMKYYKKKIISAVLIFSSIFCFSSCSSKEYSQSWFDTLPKFVSVTDFKGKKFDVTDRNEIKTLVDDLKKLKLDNEFDGSIDGSRGMTLHYDKFNVVYGITAKYISVSKDGGKTKRFQVSDPDAQAVVDWMNKVTGNN